MVGRIWAFAGCMLLFSSGCGTIRGTYTACVSTPCLASQPACQSMEDYSPVPPKHTPQEKPLPILDLEEEIPPPPPAALDAETARGEPRRLPILPPVHEAKVSLGKKIVEKFRG